MIVESDCSGITRPPPFLAAALFHCWRPDPARCRNRRSVSRSEIWRETEFRSGILQRELRSGRAYSSRRISAASTTSFN